MMLEALLLPVFIQITLTFVLMVWMGLGRAASLRRAERSTADFVVCRPVCLDATPKSAHACAVRQHASRM